MNRLLEFEKGRDTASLVWLRGKSKTCRVRIGEPIAVKIPASMCNRRDLGQYRVMSVIHEVDKNGVYSNTFEGIPASMERIPVNNVVISEAHPMLAKVISNADPESQGRVKVQFVWQEEQNKTTNWIRVRSLDAGSSEVVSKNRGFVFIPEEGDQVLVGFELNNPSRPFVSGSLFHRQNGEGGKVNNNIKSIITRSGHTIIFDDSENGESITIRDKNSNKIILDTVNKTICIEAQEKIQLTSKVISFDAAELINSTSTNIESRASETILNAAKDLSAIIDNKTKIVSKELDSTSDKVNVRSVKEDLVLISKKQVITQSGTKKIKLS